MGLGIQAKYRRYYRSTSFEYHCTLTSVGAAITGHDPEAMSNVKEQIGDKIQYASNQYDALQNAAALIIITEWSEFRTPDFDRIEKEMKYKIIFDARNLFNVNYTSKRGFRYYSIGRNSTINN